MSERQHRMSRAARTARGGFGALAATLLAAASHELAGGTATPLAVGATTILALPLCVALAGRIGSLWRLSLAVAVSQFLYHWSFSSLGLTTTTASGAPAPAHLEHLSALSALTFTPDFTSGSADAWMWAAHACAAVLTIALLHRGEHAALAIARLIGRALPHPLPRAPRVLERPAIPLPAIDLAPWHDRLLTAAAIIRRGPPAVPALTMMHR